MSSAAAFKMVPLLLTAARLSHIDIPRSTTTRREKAMRLITAPIFWLGRVTLWILFLPLGIWRSVVHGRKKSERRQAALLAAELDRRDRERAAG